MKKTFFFLLLTSLFFTACQNEPKTNESFKISINSWIGFAPLYIAQEKGYFDSQGVEVEISRMENTGEKRGAMIAGRIDALGSSIDDY